jgi:HSP20 family protein
MNPRNLIPWKRDDREVPVRRETAPNRAVGRTNDPFERFFDESNRMFDDMFRRGLPSVWTGSGGEAWPSVDLVETQDTIRVTAELPGVEEQDVEVTLDGNTLLLRGEKRREETREEDGWHHTERSFGSFQRAIPLPAEVQEDAVSAQFRKGVLTVTLPKTERARSRTRRIEVQGE